MNLVNVAGKAFKPSAIRDEPLIKPSCATENVKDTPTKDVSQEKTNQMATAGEDKRRVLLIRGFWARGSSTD